MPARKRHKQPVHQQTEQAPPFKDTPEPFIRISEPPYIGRLVTGTEMLVETLTKECDPNRIKKHGNNLVLSYTRRRILENTPNALWVVNDIIKRLVRPQIRPVVLDLSSVVPTRTNGGYSLDVPFITDDIFSLEEEASKSRWLLNKSLPDLDVYSHPLTLRVYATSSLYYAQAAADILNGIELQSTTFGLPTVCTAPPKILNIATISLAI